MGNTLAPTEALAYRRQGTALVLVAAVRHFLLGKEKPDWTALLRYEIYLLVLTPATAIFTLLPVATNWKGRFYKGKGL